MEKVRPLGDRVVISPIESPDKSKGGIVLPDTARDKPQRARVIAVGPGKMTEDGHRNSMSVKEGDLVFYQWFSGSEIEIGSERYRIVDESHLLAVIES